LEDLVTASNPAPPDQEKLRESIVSLPWERKIPCPERHSLLYYTITIYCEKRNMFAFRKNVSETCFC
jgi:hypothetical protein